MRRKRARPSRLYCLSLPVIGLLWPILGFSVSETGDYLRGSEFRQFIGEILIQFVTGIADAIMLILSSLAFGFRLV